jgi:uncharacterized protein (TIGR02147 family)
MATPSKGFQIYGTRDYRHALRELVEARRLINKEMNFQFLAVAARIPKSYLSKVLSGSANLSSDQTYLIGKTLGLRRDELNFLLLLVERERCGLTDRQQELDAEIRTIQERHMQTKEHLPSTEVTDVGRDLSQFYLTPWAPILHVALTVPKFARNPMALQKILGIEAHEFQQTLRLLESLNLITPVSKGYQVDSPNFHLPPESPAYRSWRLQQDVLTAGAMLVRRDPKHYGFSVVFATQENVRIEIRRRFLEFLSEVKVLCDESQAEDVYQMKFDIFSWTKEP